VQEICTLGSAWGDEFKKPRSLGEGTGAKASDNSEVQHVAALAILAAWEKGERRRVKLANLAIQAAERKAKPLSARPTAKYREIEFSVVQGIGRHLREWTFLLNANHLVTGQAATKLEAAAEAERAIDRAPAVKKLRLVHAIYRGGRGGNIARSRAPELRLTILGFPAETALLERKVLLKKTIARQSTIQRKLRVDALLALVLHAR
jgi:hypothetical protein